MLSLRFGQDNNRGNDVIWPSITAREGLQRLKRGARALDVRSPLEFERGNIPGFANIPILNNEHRHLVGLTYKEKGQDSAIALGLELVTPFKPSLVEEWGKTFQAASEDMRLLICWRGGLRSKMAAEWLAERRFSGVRVGGGYKALRGELLLALESPPELLVLGGLTGSGKTDLLRALEPEKVLDLEGLANHRGSSFGLKIQAVQPEQQTFENAIGLAMTEAWPVMAVEAESRMVGNCAIPTPVKEAMDRSGVVVLETTMEERVQRIFAEYVSQPMAQFSPSAVLDHLKAALKRVERKLGGLRYQEIQRLMSAAFFHRELKLAEHAPWIETLLREYYDPMYEFSLKKNERQILFSGDFPSVQAYLADRLNRRRP